ATPPPPFPPGPPARTAMGKNRPTADPSAARGYRDWLIGAGDAVSEDLEDPLGSDPDDEGPGGADDDGGGQREGTLHLRALGLGEEHRRGDPEVVEERDRRGE